MHFPDITGTGTLLVPPRRGAYAARMRGSKPRRRQHAGQHTATRRVAHTTAHGSTGSVRGLAARFGGSWIASHHARGQAG